MKHLVRASELFVKNISLVIIVFSAMAFVMPEYFRWMTDYTSVFLGVAMFGMGVSVDSSAFRSILLHPKEVIIGCTAQYTVMPAVAWILVTVTDLPPDIILGVVLVACCPGGTASNVITHIAGGSVSMSVAMTVTSTLIAPVATPALVYLIAGRWVEVSLAAMVKSVVTVILVPVLLGIAANRAAGERIRKAGPVFPFISALAVVLIIAGIIGANSEKIAECGAAVFAIVAVHNAAGFASGIVIGKIFRMEYAKTTALAIEIGMQNSGLAVSLAAMNFAANPLATLPGAIFSIWQNIAGSVFGNLRNRYSGSAEIETESVTA